MIFSDKGAEHQALQYFFQEETSAAHQKCIVFSVIYGEKEGENSKKKQFFWTSSEVTFSPESSRFQITSTSKETHGKFFLCKEVVRIFF